MIDTPRLKDIHSLLTESALSLRNESLDENIVVRVTDTTKSALQKVCADHGTNPSAFARRVFEQVITDYGMKT